ncbi:MAG: PmoA family protein [Balneolaceae bacterium]|nr:PmoA family protein [Balneolaceae bacterium]
MKKSARKNLIILFIVMLFPLTSIAQTFSIEVTAGALDRVHTVVSFHLPDDFEQGNYLLIGDDGTESVLQIDQQNRGWFILDELSAGDSKQFIFSKEFLVSDQSALAVNYLMDENTITINSGEGSVLSYFHGENNPPEELDERYRRGGYIHPVYSPSGVILTNHLNADLHPHHSGIWSGWTNTEFDGRTPDFWNIHQNTGRVDVVEESLNRENGAVFAGFSSKHKFLDLSAPDGPVTALNESWVVRVYQSGAGYHFFDLEVTQTVNSDKPLHLPEYRYGGVGFRGHADWDDPDNAAFLTAEGLGRDGHGTRTRWTHIGGHSEGELAGIAILGHPSNFRYPQTVRIHPDEPFFNFAPQQMGAMDIQPGTPYRARYRYITYDGEPNIELLNRLWNDYAWPPGVTVTEVD